MQEFHKIFIEHSGFWFTLIGFIFGTGMAWAGVRFAQKNMAGDIKDVSRKVGAIQMERNNYIRQDQCEKEQAQCQKIICSKLDEIKEWLEKDREHSQKNSIDISRIEAKIDILSTRVPSTKLRRTGD